MIMGITDIPRLYTGFAEAFACIVYVLLLSKRMRGVRLWARVAAFTAVQIMIQLVAGMLPLWLWMPGMAASAGGMLLFIYGCCDVNLRDAGYCCARAFILAEFAASLEWQFYCFFFVVENTNITVSGLWFMAVLYAAVFVAAYLVEWRSMPASSKLGIRPREMWAEICIALFIFLFSNISFLGVNTPFSSRIVPELLYIRTLVDFGGLAVLYLYQEQRNEALLRSELASIQNILHRQFEQYQQSKESIALINRKYHDIKHQIAVVRAETDPAKQSAYLAEMEHGIKAYEAQNKTGNQVLDTVLMTKSLQCSEQNIQLTCVADGALLDFMEVMDICTVFGNALDNAIESVLKLDAVKKRLIRVALYSQNNFVIIRIENYFESELRMEDGLPATTKSEKGYHGFGLKSIRYTAEKYSGSLTIRTEDDWFVLRVLIPIPSKRG